VTSPAHIAVLLEPVPRWQQVHVERCAACRGNRAEAAEVARLAHGDLDLASLLWRAREIRVRASRRVALLRRDLARR